MSEKDTKLTNPITHIETYFEKGCGRCSHFDTPSCKVHRWSSALSLLREIILSTGLQEELKWSQPCYTHKGQNVVLLASWNDAVSVSFFQGPLLADPHSILSFPGPNSRSSKWVKFLELESIEKHRDILINYIQEAKKRVENGEKIELPRADLTLPPELVSYMVKDPEFQAAFNRLTPGKQRGYVIYFGSAKQSQTRLNRIEKWRGAILEGKGMHDDYRSKQHLKSK